MDCSEKPEATKKSSPGSSASPLENSPQERSSSISPTVEKESRAQEISSIQEEARDALEKMKLYKAQKKVGQSPLLLQKKS